MKYLFQNILLDRFPTEAGVYLMKSEAGEVIYVGKAKNIKNRVKQYFSVGRDQRPMIPFLLNEINSIDTIVVASEKEALLLESRLIKQHKPKYNALLKDDKTFISLMVNYKHRWPMLKLVRYKGEPKTDGYYFGPYPSAQAARAVFDLISRLFPLRQCSDAELTGRSRPCLLYSIKRCLAPCVGKCSHDEYQLFVRRTIDFLKGDNGQVLKDLHEAMHQASAELQFERAAALLRTIRQIEMITEQQGIASGLGGQNSDVFGLARSGKDVCVTQLQFRGGNLVAAQHYAFSGLVEDDEALLRSLLMQIYQHAQHVPKEILVPFALPEAYVLSEILSVDIFYPQKGAKKECVKLAQKNALVEMHKQKDSIARKEQLLLDLQYKLHLNRFPEHIECFDTSNIAGSDPVACMTRFTGGVYNRAQKRIFKIKGSKVDDYGAQREVITRRLMRCKDENNLPDLIMVDGGKGQLNIALAVLQELDIATVDVISISKEAGKHTKGITQEKIWSPHRSEPISLEALSPLLQFLQNIRDVTHEKAIAFHRKKRSQRTLRSELETIPGIGPIKRRKLLQAFGSIAQIMQAADEAILATAGITKKDLVAIRKHATDTKKRQR